MRFVPKNSEVNSPRRRRAGLGSNGPFRPPVLARLPEIKPESETLMDVPEVEAMDEAASSKRKFRLDGAHTTAQTVSEKPAAETASTTLQPETIAESLATSQPALPPLPTADFADTAAKIMAKLDAVSANISQQSQPLHAQTATGVANPEVESPLQKSHVASAVDEIEVNQRRLRIDPGVPGPLDDSQRATKSKSLVEKREGIRNHGTLEIEALDSPWHDWIVKLGGTFIAGLLLVMAYQAVQPPKTIEYSALENNGELGTDGFIQQPLRVTNVPTTQEPGTLDSMFVTATPVPSSTPTLSSNDKPTFIDPDALPALANPPELVANDFEISPGYQSVETEPAEAMNTPQAPSLGSLVEDLMPAPAIPSDGTRDRENVAARPDTDGETPLEPVASEHHPVTPVESDSAYPTTGYAPITRVPVSVIPTAAAQQPVAKKPEFSLFPKPRTSPQVNVSDYGPSGYKFPTTVHLNGEIQKFSR